MALVIDDVMTGVATAMEAMSVTTDAGGPAQFHQTDASAEDEESAEDRAFWVEPVGAGHRNVTGITGIVDRFIRFRVRVKYVNEGRNSTDWAGIILQDMSRIMDRVAVYLLTSVSGVNAAYLDGECSVDRDAAEPSVYYVVVPFVVEYQDDHTTA